MPGCAESEIFRPVPSVRPFVIVSFGYTYYYVVILAVFVRTGQLGRQNKAVVYGHDRASGIHFYFSRRRAKEARRRARDIRKRESHEITII